MLEEGCIVKVAPLHTQVSLMMEMMMTMKLKLCSKRTQQSQGREWEPRKKSERVVVDWCSGRKSVIKQRRSGKPILNKRTGKGKKNKRQKKIQQSTSFQAGNIWLRV